MLYEVITSNETIVASQTGDLFLGAESSSSLVPIQIPVHTLTAAMSEADDGTLIVAGRGISRLFLNGGGD